MWRTAQWSPKTAQTSYYAADWSEYVLACELRASGDAPGAALVHLSFGQTGRGRSNRALSLLFHSDGDIHVDAKGKGGIWRAGSGKLKVSDWVSLCIELTRQSLTIYGGEWLIGTVDLAGLPLPKGGIMFYSDAGGCIAWLHNPRVKVLSR